MWYDWQTKARVLAVVMSFALLATPLALHSQEVPSSIKSGVRRAIAEAESDRFLSPPTLDQRRTAGLRYLRAEAYYGASIEPIDPALQETITEENAFIVDIEDEAQSLLIRPGAPFSIASFNLEITGPESEELAASRAKRIRETEEIVGQPALASEVLQTQSVALAALKDEGFTQSRELEGDIVVDHANQSMIIVHRIDSGPLTRFGNLIVEGASRTPESWVRFAADLKTGAPATGESLREISNRFRDTGAYLNARVELMTPRPADGVSTTADVMLNLEERTRRIWSVGAEWSTSEGVGLDASTSIFHRLRRADTLTLDGRLGTLETSIGARLLLPSTLRAGRDLALEARIGQEDTEAFERLIAQLDALYLIPRGEKDLLTLGASIDVTRTQLPDGRLTGEPDAQIDGIDFNLLGRYELDRSDSVLDPREGWRAQVELQPAYFVSKDNSAPYLRVLGAVSTYREIGALTDGVIAARVRAGVLLSETDVLPFDRLFFAGGGGSVRGYPYQSIGPRDANDFPIGGNNLIEASIEFRWSVRGPFGAAVFADIGRVGSFDDASVADTRAGVGVGVRYDLGIAPLRLDLAVPLDRREGDPPVQVYLSAGQSF